MANPNAETIVLPIYEHPSLYEHFFSKSFFQNRASSPKTLLRRIRIKGFAPYSQMIQIEINDNPLQGEWINSHFDLQCSVDANFELNSLVNLKIKTSKSVWIEYLSFEFDSNEAQTQKRNSRFSPELFFGSYDPSLPLFFYHIPKTAGISIKAAMNFWFQEKFFSHYREGAQKMDPPPKHPLTEASCLFGHSSLHEQTTFEKYYPKIHQRITFFRDPFDRFVSNHFFVKPTLKEEQKRTLAESLEHTIQTQNSGFLDFLPPITPEFSIETYLKTHFLYVGLHESAQKSINHMAYLMGKKQVELPKLNLSQYDEKIPDLRKEFRTAMKREYELYDYIRELHHRDDAKFHGS